MINPFDIAVIVGITAIVLLIIITVMALLFSRPRTTSARPRKGSLPPLHGGYRALDTFEVRRPHPNPPKAPEGAGAGSMPRNETTHERNERWAREGVPPVM